jgi:hypothetical protein
LCLVFGARAVLAALTQMTFLYMLPFPKTYSLDNF